MYIHVQINIVYMYIMYIEFEKSVPSHVEMGSSKIAKTVHTYTYIYRIYIILYEYKRAERRRADGRTSEKHSFLWRAASFFWTTCAGNCNVPESISAQRVYRLLSYTHRRPSARVSALRTKGRRVKCDASFPKLSPCSIPRELSPLSVFQSAFRRISI